MRQGAICFDLDLTTRSSTRGFQVDMMRRNPKSFRLTTTVALTALLSGVMLPPAMAQPAPPPGQVPPPDQNQGDPPARVGRIARVAGQVSYPPPMTRPGALPA